MEKEAQRNLFELVDYSISERNIIGAISNEFKKCEFFEITKIYNILHSIKEENKNISKWKDKVKFAIDTGNQVLFDYLIKAC